MFRLPSSLLVLFFFFFKQKTAYEMRISDWSSDVCSSDLTSAEEDGIVSGGRIRKRDRMRTPTTLDIGRIRAAYPSLAVADEGRPRVYFDNPGGTQVPQRVIDRTVDCLLRTNANLGGPFASSVAAGAMVDEAHRAMADFLGAESADEIVFGQNMTSLTFQVSRSIGRTLRPGDEIVVTRMDHDANKSGRTKV